MIENINQKIDKLQSCTSSNPGHPDSDKKNRLLSFFKFHLPKNNQLNTKNHTIQLDYL
jgi:hypothetical protein